MSRIGWWFALAAVCAQAGDEVKPLSEVQATHAGKRPAEFFAAALRSGTPATFTLPAVQSSTLFTGDFAFTIDVPADATQLDVTLTTATQGADVDLHVRFGAEPMLSGGQALSDFASKGLGGNEAISIPASSLKAGTYFIAFSVFTFNVNITSTVTATVSRPTQPIPLAAFPANAQAISHIVNGAGWSSSLYVTNLSAVAENFSVRLFKDDGTPWRVTISALGVVDTLTGSLAPGETRVFDTVSGVAQDWGWAALIPATTGAARLSGFAVFRQRVNNSPPSEATAGMTAMGDRQFVLLFDTTGGAETGVALANPNPTAPLTIAVTIRSDSGRVLATDRVTLPALGHTAFAVSQRFPAAANQRGSLLLSASPSGVIALGLRFSPILTFTSFPALTGADIQR